MSRLWWVRHAPTHERAFTGWRDVPADLSDAGALARLRAMLPEGAVLASSDLSRAVATADALAPGAPRLPPDPALREFDFGDWDGRTWDEVAERHPALSRAYWETPGDVAAPGGESWNAARARIDAAVARLLAAHTGRDVVVVAHMGTILTQVQRARGCAAQAVLAQRIEPLSVTRLDRDGTGWLEVFAGRLA